MGTTERASKRKGVMFIVVATLGFSLIPILAQVGLSPKMTAGTLLFYRFFIAGILFFIYCLVTGRKVMLHSGKQYFFVIIAGCIYSAQCIFFFSSFNYISSSIGEILYHCYPLFVLILAYIVLKESITYNKVIGVILSIIGVSIVLYAPWSDAEIKGIVYVILTAAISAIYMVYTKKFVADIETTILTMYLCFTCSTVYLTYTLIQGEFVIPNEGAIVANIFILAICSTVIGFFCFMKSISLLTVGEVSILSLLEPVFTVIIAFLILDVKLTVVQLCGSAVILASIYVYDKPSKPLKE